MEIGKHFYHSEHHFMQTKVPNRKKEKKRETSSEIIKEELQFLQAGVSNPSI